MILDYLVLMKMHAADGAGVPVQGVHAGSALRVPHFQCPAQGTGTANVRMYSVLLWPGAVFRIRIH
jgi:hypothetical protein